MCGYCDDGWAGAGGCGKARIAELPQGLLEGRLSRGDVGLPVAARILDRVRRVDVRARHETRRYGLGCRVRPAMAQEIGCANWAQFLLKFVVSHPAVTCAIPATSRVDHLQENMGAAHGPLPDQAMRARMIAAMRSV